MRNTKLLGLAGALGSCGTAHERPDANGGRDAASGGQGTVASAPTSNLSRTGDNSVSGRISTGS